MGITVKNTAVHYSYSTSSNEDEKFKFTSLTKHIHALVHLNGPCRENQSPLFQVQPKKKIPQGNMSSLHRPPKPDK